MRWLLWTLLMHVALALVWADEPVVVQHVDEGERLLAAGQLEAAIQAYEKALAAGAGSALFLNRLGSLYLRAERYDEAASTFRRSMHCEGSGIKMIGDADGAHIFILRIPQSDVAPAGRATVYLTPRFRNIKPALSKIIQNFRYP